MILLSKYKKALLNNDKTLYHLTFDRNHYIIHYFQYYQNNVLYYSKIYTPIMNNQLCLFDFSFYQTLAPNMEYCKDT